MRGPPSVMMAEYSEVGRAGRGNRLLWLGAAVLVLAWACARFSYTRAASRRVDPGFDPRQVLTASVVLPAARYPDADALRPLAPRAVDAT